MIYYKCIHFDIEELVDRQTYKKWGEKAWMFFRPETLISLDNIRKHFQRPVWVNNWSIGGDFQNRGLRLSYSMVGDEYSQHRFGNGFDLDVQDMKAEEVRQEILIHKDAPLLIGIMCLETNISWVHFDCRNIEDRIRLIKP